MLRGMTHSVLVVEDDPDVAALTIRTLERAGFGVTHVATGRDAIARVADQPPAVVLLDLGLPDIDGLEVCRQIRAADYHGGVIAVTARTSEGDIILGFDAGADDYLAKPFGLAELRSRVQALVHRNGRPAVAPAAATGSGVRIETASRRAVLDGVEIPLTGKEFDLLVLLLTRIGEVVPYPTLAAVAGFPSASGSTKVLDFTISRLRGKLEASGATERVTSVQGTGARLDVASA